MMNEILMQLSFNVSKDKRNLESWNLRTAQHRVFILNVNLIYDCFRQDSTLLHLHYSNLCKKINSSIQPLWDYFRQ